MSDRGLCLKRQNQLPGLLNSQLQAVNTSMLFYMADDGGIVGILNNEALSMPGVAVIKVQCEQGGSEDTALGGSCVPH